MAVEQPIRIGIPSAPGGDGGPPVSIEEGGGQVLTIATIADTELLQRVGTTVDGIARAGVDSSAFHGSDSGRIAALTAGTPAANSLRLFELAAGGLRKIAEGDDIAARHGQLGALISRGIALSTIPASTALAYATVFASGNWSTSVGGSGAATYDTTSRRVKLTTGATGSSSANLFNGVMLYLAEGTSASRFYWAFRAAVTTAVDANTVAAMVNGGSCGIGVLGSVSTAKYVCDFNNGDALLSSVDIDTAEHLFEVWRDGTTTYFSVDGETPVTGTGIFQTVADRFQWQVQNQGTAAARTIEVKSLVVVTR